MSLSLFVLCIALLLYIYGGYLLLLRLAAALLRAQHPGGETRGPLPSVTVLVTVHNEAAHIRAKVDNVLAQTCPSAFEVLVASDGSTDGTDELVLGFGDPRVRLFRSEGRLGKTATQNRAVEQARGEVILFTDAETVFDEGFLDHMVRPFADPAVGCTTGELRFVSESGATLSEGQGLYWRYELALRESESRLGILAVASGACMAVRRDLLKRLEPEYGEDCVVPLDVVLSGKKVVHVPGARAYDRPAATGAEEFRARVRMTLRNWGGTLSRKELLNPLRHPGYAFSLWSHKMLRWLSPLFLLGATATALFVVRHPPSLPLVAGLVATYALGLVGWLGERRGRRYPLASSAYGFFLTNAGFLVGLWQAFSGRKIASYR